LKIEMKVAIFGRNFDFEYAKYIQSFFENLYSLHSEVIIYDKFFHFLVNEANISLQSKQTFSDYSGLKGTSDMLFSIGGDGTILDALNVVRDSNIPVIGINTGKLGFLASVAIHETGQAIESIVNKQFTLDKRSLLKVESTSGKFNDFPFGLNEITVQKSDSTMITVQVEVDGEYLNSYWADGLIVSTPTGSTAYSLSVGGPVITPQSGNIIISPISPHNLTVRPLVLPDNCRLKLKVDSRAHNHIISLDHRSIKVDNDEEIFVSKADFSLNLIQLNNSSFYNTLRNKLMWGVDKRN